MRAPLALLCLVALAPLALARLGPTQSRSPEARPLLEAGTQLVFTGTEAVTPPCDLTDISAALSSPNCSSASNYTTLVPPGTVLHSGQATVYARHYNNTDDLLALNVNGIAWDITATESATKEMLLALGVAASTRAAEACMLQLLNNNACNSSEIKFLWGSGIEADVLGDASSGGGMRVSQPVLLRIPANIPGLVAAIAAPAEQPWHVIANDELRSLPAPEFVLFAGVAANVSVTVNAVALLGLTVVPVDPTQPGAGPAPATDPTLSNPDGSIAGGGGDGGDGAAAPPTGGMPSGAPIPEPTAPDGSTGGGAPDSPAGVPPSPASTPVPPASPDTPPRSSSPVGGDAGGPVASPDPPSGQAPAPTPAEPTQPAPAQPVDAPAPAPGPAASPVSAALPSPSPKPVEPAPSLRPSPSPEPAPVPPSPSPKPAPVPPSPSPKPAEAVPVAPVSPSPAPSSVDSDAGGGKTGDGTTGSPPSSQPGSSDPTAIGGGGGDAGPGAAKGEPPKLSPPSSDLPSTPIQ